MNMGIKYKKAKKGKGFLVYRHIDIESSQLCSCIFNLPYPPIFLSTNIHNV